MLLGGADAERDRLLASALRPDEPGNADELADCIERVLTDDELAEELVRRGREILQATYSWDAIAGRTLAVYQEALAS